ncbi:hypothetical protein SAMN05421854_106377 [Amycolatopsis rubida]|uniref:Uncharacterized protein n=1 Tax=Amycolatopsis rubida TaxID=112413 RepID=A0A1I5SMK1_9PSEU|nr:hypothetical protein SAMN05421854_106377 [Amycolatopsis rubida]
METMARTALPMSSGSPTRPEAWFAVTMARYFSSSRMTPPAKSVAGNSRFRRDRAGASPFPLNVRAGLGSILGEHAGSSLPARGRRPDRARGSSLSDVDARAGAAAGVLRETGHHALEGAAGRYGRSEGDAAAGEWLCFPVTIEARGRGQTGWLALALPDQCSTGRRAFPARRASRAPTKRRRPTRPALTRSIPHLPAVDSACAGRTRLCDVRARRRRTAGPSPTSWLARRRSGG